MVPSMSCASSRRSEPLLQRPARAAALLLACGALLGGCSSDSCDDVETEIGLVCIPDALAPQGPTVLQVRESCGKDCASGPTCTAVLVDGALVLTLHERQCLSLGCSSSTCLQSVVSCTLPGLLPGDYPVVVRGGAPQLLHVRTGGAPSCLLPQAPPSP